jgi:hypothetical protein
MQRGLSLRAAAPFLIAICLASPVPAVNYYFAVDVPTTLGSLTFTPNQVVSSANASYSLSVAFGVEVEVSALYLRADGDWLFAASEAGGGRLRAAGCGDL